MPPIEPTMFQNIVQGGSFALIVLFGCWLMFRVEPRNREDSNKKDERNAESAEKKDTTHAETIKTIVESSERRVEVLINKFAEMVQKAHDDCREERRDTTETMQKEFKLNREARHDDADKMAAVVSEFYELLGVARNHKLGPPTATGT